MNDDNLQQWSDIDVSVYDWSVKVFRTLKRALKVNMTLHAREQVLKGDIFLFNHFARFETFIPQYLIYEESGAYCCSIASSEFFKGDTVLSRFLQQVGVLPHDHERLFPYLSEQILRGRKVIIFPEGGMVKDRRVLDKEGKFSIYSRMTDKRRKHHTGPAVLAQGLEAFKATIRNAYSNKKTDQLLNWKDSLGLEHLDQLLIPALKPTLIIPSYITFYPIRSSDNVLLKSVEMFSEGLSLRQTEELLIEGNIILKDTDMDIYMGKPVDPYQSWHWWNHYLLNTVSSEFQTLDEVFKLHFSPKSWRQKILGQYFSENAKTTRNQYMAEMYANVMINLSHLASALIMCCVSQGQHSIKKHLFNIGLYIAIKRLQKVPDFILHRSLLDPDDYSSLLKGENKGFAQFVLAAESTELIQCTEDEYRFLPKLLEEFDLDSIRMENVIAVYDNEVAPIPVVRDTVINALDEAPHVNQEDLADWLFDDECLAWKYEKKFYTQTRFDMINHTETATESPEPFFLKPVKPNGIAVLLVHGMLASPAELRGYGEYLRNQGYLVLGIRIKGHGTSPYDLRTRTWEDWYESVEKGLAILNASIQRILLVGFSTGGALALKLAAEHPQTIMGVVTVSVPIKFVDSAMMLVPLLHGTNKFVSWVSSYEGVKPFIENKSEHPNVNYRNIPVHSLYELRMLIQDLDGELGRIKAPTLVIQADEDPVVEQESGQIILKKLGSDDKQLIKIQAKHHGILMDNVGGTWKMIDEFLHRCKPRALEEKERRESEDFIVDYLFPE